MTKKVANVKYYTEKSENTLKLQTINLKLKITNIAKKRQKVLHKYTLLSTQNEKKKHKIKQLRITSILEYHIEQITEISQYYAIISTKKSNILKNSPQYRPKNDKIRHNINKNVINN